MSRTRGRVSRRVWNSVQTYFCMRIYCKIKYFQCTFLKFELFDLLKCWFLASLCFCRYTFFWPKCCITIVTSSQSAFYPANTLLWDVLGIVYTRVCASACRYSARWEIENAGKPVIMNLHVLTVAHYCRLFATKCIFIRLNCSGVVRGLLSWDFYTRWERKKGLLRSLEYCRWSCIAESAAKLAF